MAQQPSGEPTDDRDDQDREVSRRVRNATGAAPGDEAAYRAADPAPDDDSASADQTEPGAGGAAESAAAEVADTDEGEPERSE